MNYKNTHPHYRELVVENYKDGILKLIEPDLKYAELSLEWVSTAEIVQYMGADFSNPSLEGEEKRIQDILENKDEYHWMIELDGKVIGNVNINSIAENSEKFGVKAASPAILIGDKQGIGYHAMKAVLRWAFHETGFELIAARALQENIASTKNLEKLGFEADGIEPYEGLVNGNISMWKKYKLIKSSL